MRYRVIEEDRGGWIPVATVFAWEDDVFCLVAGRAPFLRVNAPSLEAVTLDYLPYQGDQFRLGPVAEAELPEHPLQPQAHEQGEELPAEFIEENHFELLSRLKREHAAA